MLCAPNSDCPLFYYSKVAHIGCPEFSCVFRISLFPSRWNIWWQIWLVKIATYQNVIWSSQWSTLPSTGPGSEVTVIHESTQWSEEEEDWTRIGEISKPNFTEQILNLVNLVDHSSDVEHMESTAGTLQAASVLQSKNAGSRPIMRCCKLWETSWLNGS